MRQDGQRMTAGTRDVFRRIVIGAGAMAAAAARLSRRPARARTKALPQGGYRMTGHVEQAYEAARL